jgi:hypothetical protein
MRRWINVKVSLVRQTPPAWRGFLFPCSVIYLQDTSALFANSFIVPSSLSCCAVIAERSIVTMAEASFSSTFSLTRYLAQSVRASAESSCINRERYSAINFCAVSLVNMFVVNIKTNWHHKRRSHPAHGRATTHALDFPVPARERRRCSVTTAG